MNKRVAAFLVLLVGGSLAIVGFYFAKPRLAEYLQKRTSDAAGVKGSISIGVDNWIGYFPLCSNEMRKRLHSAGYLLKCMDDSADYPGRMQQLAERKLDFAVATVDSFLLNAAGRGFPGTIIMVIDESKGGDALVAQKARIASLEDLKSKTGFQVAFTPHSPSEHLLRAISVHFDIPSLRDKQAGWRVPVEGSTQALAKLTDGQVDMAVLWEPDVSKALAKPGVVKVLGTEDTKKLIVDVLLVGREFAQKQPEAVAMLLSNYFRTLKHYRDHPEQLAEEIRDATKLAADQVDTMLRGVRWVNLFENARDWFGIPLLDRPGQEGVIDTIESAQQILIDCGNFAESPIPDRDPYRLQNRQFIDDLVRSGSQFENTAGAQVAENSGAIDRKFTPLTEAAWANLAEIGTFKIRPISFQSGTADLALDGKTELDAAAASLAHYPNFRIVIRGHTGLRGDAAANLALSQERGDAVKKYLMITHQIDEHRMRAVGFGADRPLARDPTENDRAYEYRLPRVELVLVSGVF